MNTFKDFFKSQKMMTLAIFILCLCFFSAYAQELKTTWDYPVKPGTAEWASFTTTQQMLDAVQIPQNVLEKLNTNELAEICFNYPFYLEYTALDDGRLAISIMIEIFNGLKELSQRKDGAWELINLYQNFPVLTQIQEKSSKDYYSPIKLPFLELLIANDVFIKQLDAQKADVLERIVREKYKNKLNNSHIYSMWNIQKTFLLGAVVINQHTLPSKTATQRETVKRFIENYNQPDPELFTKISKIISGL